MTTPAIGTFATGKRCHGCDRLNTVVFTERLVEDRSMGQPFLGPSERVAAWVCRVCRYSHDGSFDPSSPDTER